MNALLLGLSVLVAATPPTDSGGAHALRVDSSDVIITGAAAAVWVSSETFLKHALRPETCRWCDRADDGSSTVSRFDGSGRTLRWALEDQQTADTLSNVIGFGVMPAAVFGMDAYLAHDADALGLFPEDALIVAQSVTLALVFNQAVKFAVGRERPFVHVLPPAAKGFTKHPTDNNLSFFSGHTTYSFSLLTSMATVAELRGYRRPWLVWLVGLPFALATPYLRMAADRHYLSDILTGAAVGTAFGIGIPRLFHQRLDAAGVELRVTPAPSGIGLSGRF